MYDKKKLRDILINEKYKTIDNKGKIFPPPHTVYSLISDTLANNESNISPK